MKVAVLSGKGGAGKTLLAVNLAAAAGKATYVDCDVEEPNGRLFLRPEGALSQPVYTPLPAFDRERCDGCRKCVDFCRFHALVYVKGAPMVFPEVCHACGGCSLVCPRGAVTEARRPVGLVEEGWRDGVRVITGELSPGEASGIPVIQAALRAAGSPDGLTVLDCPPGSACPVMECVAAADFCLLVTEPTAFGLDNLQMVYELVTLLRKPCGLVINKAEGPWPPLEDFCARNGLEVLLRLPFRRRLAELTARGELACLRDGEASAAFRALAERLGVRP